MVIKLQKMAQTDDRDSKNLTKNGVKGLFFAVPILLVIGSCSSTETQTTDPSVNVLTEEEIADGWQLLFNGKDLTGWHSYLRSEPGKAWKVEGGTIILDKNFITPRKHCGDLTSDREFENFHLKVGWKLKPCKNSGLFFYVHEDPEYRYPGTTGPEMQIVDLDCSPDSRILKSRAGALYSLIPVDVEPVTPGGQWNQYEIIANMGHLELFINGTKVIETQLWTDEWKALIAGSGKSEYSDFGTFQKGHIAFQGTEPGTRIWFRNIKIKEL
jgi:hypothetical protein